MICLVAVLKMLKHFVKHVPSATQYIIEISDKPLTVIYDHAQNLVSNLITNDGTISIRIPDDDFCYWLTRKLNGVVVSTSANISPKPTPKSYKEIAPAILKGVDYVVNLHHEKICNKPSLIIKLSNNGLVKVIRE
tara:strand:- start:7177 stop:7581 length:405 start_codon:yes stop_codon:yes gene_type:complete